MPTVRNNKGKAELKLLGREAGEIDGGIETCKFVSNNFQSSDMGKLAGNLAVDLLSLREKIIAHGAWPLAQRNPQAAPAHAAGAK